MPTKIEKERTEKREKRSDETALGTGVRCGADDLLSISSPIQNLNISTPKSSRKRGRPPQNIFQHVLSEEIDNSDKSFTPDESSLNQNMLRNKIKQNSFNPISVDEVTDFNSINIKFATEKNQECQFWRKTGLNLYENDDDCSGTRVIETLWNNPDQWLNERFTFAFLCFIAKKSHRHAVVADSVLSDPNLQITRNERVIRNGCFNFDPHIATEILLIPLFFGNHWALAIHDVETGTYFIDSLQQLPSRLSILNTANFHPNRIPLLKQIIFTITGKNLDNEFMMIVQEKISQQPDLNSCGYFICLFSEAWLFNFRNLILEPIDLITEKRRILWHLNLLYTSDEIFFYCRYKLFDYAFENSSNMGLIESSSDNLSSEISSKNRGGRPKKRRRTSIVLNPVEPINNFDTPTTSKVENKQKITVNISKNQQSSHIFETPKTSKIEKTLKTQQIITNIFNSNEIDIPLEHLPPSVDRIVTYEVIGARDLLLKTWSDYTEWFSEDFLYVFQRYIATLVKDKIVTVLSPLCTELNIHFGQDGFEFNVLENCFNYSPNYDILLMTVYYPGHFALIIFDRTIRQFPKCLCVDSLPEYDRLKDLTYPNYDERRQQLIKKILCELTPDLTNDDIVIHVLSSEQFTPQNDKINCGFFVALYSEAYLMNNCNLILPNLDINIERRRILYHIIQLINNNNVPYTRRNVNFSEIHNYPTEAIVQGDCPRDKDGAFICVEPIIETEPDVVLFPHSRSPSISSIDSLKTPSRRSIRIQNKNPSGNENEKLQNCPKNSITQRCYKKHEGLPCADIRSQHTTDYYDSGEIGEIICEYCFALLLKSEAVKKHGKISSGTCCNHGKVVLPKLETFPSPLKNYLKGETQESMKFLSLQNAYNSLLAFASISVGYQESSLDGDKCFLLNGEFVHKISSVLPGKFKPSFSQLYILDPTSALENRTKNVAYGGDRVDNGVLKNLDSMLRKHHPLARELINFHTQYQKALAERGPDSVKNFRLTLIEERYAPSTFQDKSLHPRQVNLPDEGDTLFAIWTENERPPCLKGIWITNDEGKIQKFPPYHPKTDSLCYPLLFPKGEDGYHKNIPYNNVTQNKNSSVLSTSEMETDEENDQQNSSDSETMSNISLNSTKVPNKRKNASVRDYIRYRMALRRENTTHNIWSSGGGLSQKFVLDYAARIDSDYANFIRKPEFNLRSTLPENILRWLARNSGLNSPEELGSIVLFRKHDPGTRPYFQQKFYDATTIMARCRRPGYASFMLTFTTNPKWPEIKRNFLHRGQRTVDRSDLICRIYEDKLKDLHYHLEKKNLFGKMIGQESREFQKKYGGPHAHRIFTTDILAIPENIENLIWAHIPPEPDATDKSSWANFIRTIRKLLPQFQFHDCGQHCLNNKGRCRKGFPKPFSNLTILYDDRPAQYYRPSPQNGGQTLTVKRGQSTIIYDNSRVSSYNPFILVRYATHHNIEFVYGKTNNFKYIYKYPFKGPSFSYVKSKEQNKTNIDEPAFYARMLYRSSPEAYSRIMSYKYAFLSHTVISLSLHLPGQQKIYMKPGKEDEIAQRVQAGELPETPLTAYWNRWRNDPEIKKILYENIPEKYSFNKSGKIWKKRNISKSPAQIKKRKPIIGRIFPISPRNPELFALYLLTKHFPGDPDHLKTVNPPHKCTTFLEAARLRGLIDDNDVWIRTMEEGAASLMPGQMRQLFANILIFGSTESCLIDGALLWEKFLHHMYDTRCSVSEQSKRIDRALALIERLLVQNNKQCKDYGLPSPTFSIINDPQRGLNEFFFPQHINDDEIDTTVDTSAYETNNLNEEQQKFFDLIKTAFINPDKQRLFYLFGDGGTGKTFLLNYILFNLRKIGAKIIPTASTGMASTRFYVGGTTVHSAFKFGIDIEQGKLPSIPFDSFFGRRIIEADIIIVDEVTMLDRTVFENVDALCRLMCSKKRHLPFGGKCVIISGDWKQSLPVVIDYHGTPAQIAACLQSSPLYPMFQKFKLVQSMRVNPKEKEFLEWLDNIGKGTGGDTTAIPQNMLVDSREELIDWVFDKGFDISTNDLLKRLLLGTTNRIVDLNNSLILERFNSSYVDYYSVDKALNENPLAVNALEFDVSELNLLNPLGMPHHHLKLKVGSIIVLLLNLNTAKGLCNGTRLIVKKLTPNLIEAEAITGGSSKSGIILGIPRHRSTYKDKRPDGISFERFQFPVRIAFTMTIVKAQGQTCSRLGIDFTEEPFSHGQLYTALSRVTSPEGIKIYAPNKPLNDNGEPKIRNIVAEGVQFD